MTTDIRTTQPQKDARERLLASALEQFTRAGYAATSVRELCEAAGVTKPVLYYYFKSKEGLYLELMEGAYSLFETTVAELTMYRGGTQEQIINFCEGVFDIGIANLPLLRLIYSIYFGTPQGAPHFDLDRYYDRMLEIICGLIQEGIDQGELRPGNVSDMTWAVLSCLNTTLEEQLCHQHPRIDRAAMVRMLGLLLRGIAMPERA
jgi:AcrR family transcriptional regulator